MELRRDFKTAILLGIVFALVFDFSLNNFAIAQNGSLYLSPSSGQVTVGQTFSLALRVNTGGTAINASEGSILFDQQKLSVVSISKSSSIFSIWAEDPKFSNAEGTIEFAGGIPNPGYSGSNGLIMTITFRARTATGTGGNTDITLVSGGILANDGYGTNILASLGKASYSIVPGLIVEPTKTPKETEIPVAGNQKINITSNTHPEQSKWYSNNNPQFKWNLPSEVTGVMLVLSRRENSPPIISYIPPISEKTLTDLDEGEWYLNGKFITSLGSGPVTSFKFNIDTRPPEKFSIVRLDEGDLTNPRPELLFDTIDATSGIDHYELIVNGDKPINIKPNEIGNFYSMLPQEPGDKNLQVIAFDKAGNKTSSNSTIHVQSIDSPRIDKVSEKVKVGEDVLIFGASKADQKIVIYAVNKNEKTYETTANKNGEFELAISDLAAGKYKIYARAKDERGAISNSSNEVNVYVVGGKLDLIFRIFDWAVNLFSRGGLFMAFIVALVGLLLVLIELIKIRFGKWFKKVADWLIVKMARKKSAKKVLHIVKDMQDEIKFLNQIAKRRSLSTEEKYLKSKISSYIKMLRYIDKEID